MGDVLSITFPIFAAVAVGYASVALVVFKSSEMRVLGRFVLYIALPALLFRAVATRDLAEVIHPGYLTTFTLAGLGALAVGYISTWAAGTGPARRATAGMGMAIPNSAFVGYPVLLLALPDRAEQVLALNFLAENFVLVPVSLMLLELSRPRGDRSLARSFVGIFRTVLTQPFVVALISGFAVSLTEIALPEPVDRTLSIFAGGASAVALVVLGGTLHGLPLRGNRVLAGVIAGGKLIVHPAMAVAAAALVMGAGIDLPPDLRLAAILSAAVPMFTVYVLFVQPYGHDGLASLAVLSATAGAFVTLSVVLALLL